MYEGQEQQSALQHQHMRSASSSCRWVRHSSRIWLAMAVAAACSVAHGKGGDADFGSVQIVAKLSTNKPAWHVPARQQYTALASSGAAAYRRCPPVCWPRCAARLL